MSLIGFMIMMPFFFMAYVDTQGEALEHIQRTNIQHAIEEASMDAAFVMKTYSESYFDSDNVYKIEIPYDEVVDVFFDSLTFREFQYARSDFPIIAFLTYDGIVFYNPTKKVFYPKIYYLEETFEWITKVNLGKTQEKIHKESLARVTLDVKQLDKQRIILKSLEKGLNRMAISLSMDKEYVFSLPESDNSFYQSAINDISFIAFYSSSSYYGLGRLDIFSIKPSGIMKMNEVLPIDI